MMQPRYSEGGWKTVREAIKDWHTTFRLIAILTVPSTLAMLGGVMLGGPYFASLLR